MAREKIFKDEHQYWKDMEMKQSALEQVPDKRWILYQNYRYIGHFATCAEACAGATGKRFVTQHHAELFGKPRPPRKIAFGK